MHKKVMVRDNHRETSKRRVERWFVCENCGLPAAVIFNAGFSDGSRVRCFCGRCFLTVYKSKTRLS